MPWRIPIDLDRLPVCSPWPPELYRTVVAGKVQQRQSPVGEGRDLALMKSPVPFCGSPARPTLASRHLVHQSWPPGGRAVLAIGRARPPPRGPAAHLQQRRRSVALLVGTPLVWRPKYCVALPPMERRGRAEFLPQPWLWLRLTGLSCDRVGTADDEFGPVLFADFSLRRRAGGCLGGHGEGWCYAARAPTQSGAGPPKCQCPCWRLGI